jgi:HAD superfamily hydrolase (TIGR01509 family)
MLGKIENQLSKSILVFDLHGVIFTFSIWAGIKDFWQLTYKQKLLVLRAACTPGLAWDALKLLFTGAVVEQAVLNIKTKYPHLAGVIPFALKIINNQIPKPEMAQLLRDLNSQGYKLLIFSNIGEQSISILKQKYPEIFSCFTGELVASASDNYLSKPQPAAFNKFLEKFSDLNNFLLIDDRDKNLQAAQACGMQVIKFKSSAQLIRDLHNF